VASQPEQRDAAEVKPFDEIGLDLQGLAKKKLRSLEVSILKTDSTERLQRFQAPGTGQELAVKKRSLRTPPLGMELPSSLKRPFTIC